MKYLKILVWVLIFGSIILFWVGLRKGFGGMLETLMALSFCLSAIAIEQYIKYKQKKEKK